MSVFAHVFLKFTKKQGSGQQYVTRFAKTIIKWKLATPLKTTNLNTLENHKSQHLPFDI